MKYRNLVAALIVVVGLAILIAGNNNAVYNQRINSSPKLQINESRLESMTADEILGDQKVPELVKEIKLASNSDQTREVKTGDTISVHYRGWLAKDGTVFDQSFERAQPFTFKVGQGVIEGWSEGVVGMKLSEVRRLKIPSNLAYGETDQGSIPANSDLIFDVELMEIR